MTAALSLNEIRKRCAEVVRDWKDQPGEERQEAQSFVRDLLAAFGITKTKAALYEHRARRVSTGNRGYIDALIPGQALFEMKSRGKDLEAAEEQALDYIDDLNDVEKPQWVITSDFHRFRVLNLAADPGEDGRIKPVEFTLGELPQHAEDLAFLAGYQTTRFGDREQEEASVKAAQMMAKLYEGLSASHYDDHAASVFLVRTLFALYADDSGMWERDLFYEFLLTRTSEDGSDLGLRLAHLFQEMNKPVERRQRNLDELVARFPYVNGGLFKETIEIPSFDADMRSILLDACAFNWAQISPAIFGSLFQAVKSAEARRSLGEHYTTESNILKTINPLFMDELRDRFTHHLHDVAGLKALRSDLAKLRIMDPACGCGNFLVVAYRELRELDLKILLRLQELGDTSQLPTLFFDRKDLPVSLEHFYGIEIEEWPARIATTALYLVDHQANQRMELALGKAPESLPLETLSTIHVSNALRTDWADVMEPGPDSYILGNPPFLGHATRTPEQAQELRDVWGRKDIGRLDYVTAWYKKALDFYGDHAGRFAFVSTNSIAQGEPVPALFRPLFEAGWRIRFAHRTFAWTSEAPGAAAVHCVIVGFDRQKRGAARVFSYATPKGEPSEEPAKQLNAYLLDAPLVFLEQTRKPLSPELGPVTMGSMPRDGGHLIISEADYPDFAADSIAMKYVRRFLMGRELLYGTPRWCLWLTELDPSDLKKSPLLRERLKKVADFRAGSKAASTRAMVATPHLFGQRAQPTVAYVGIPRVTSESRYFYPVQHLGPEVIAGDKVYTTLDADGFVFGILSSSMFMIWQKALGGRLESRLNFSNTIVWNNLPLPAVSDATRQAVIEGGRKVLEARALHQDRSLADHYNPLAMAPELLKAHVALDRAVDKAFGARGAVRDDDDRLALLFKRYAEMSADS
ncbi:DNA methyltransferase [Micrococcus lylae]|uniref:DNA methyltransferase n=1 Tax=Micrococcus lylae TaxID=1273 RepID=UPI003EB993D5